MKKLNLFPLLILVALNQPLAAQTVHQFSGITALPDKTISLTLTGSVDAVYSQYFDLYVVETSTNLADWTPLVTLQSANTSPNPLVYLDTEAAKLPTRFYRTYTNPLITPFPKLTGPYPVGRVSRLLNDPSRTGRYGDTNCQFMVTLWYPAIGIAGVLPGSYVDEQIDNRFHAHALPGVPMVANQAKFPVVIYSHGAIGRRTENTDKVEHLASHGYIVVGIDHAGVTTSVFPDGTVVHATDDAKNSGGACCGLWQDKIQDIQFVMDELGRLNNGDPMFAGRIDLERIGVFGWSFGGMASVEVCRIDLRCRAGVSLDGGGPLDMSAVFDTPFMIAQGQEISRSAAAISGPGLKELFDRLPGNAYWFKLQDARHEDFGDVGALIGNPSRPPAPRYAAILRTYLLSFFNKHLKGQDDHLLDGPLPDYPEIKGYSKK